MNDHRNLITAFHFKVTFTGLDGIPDSDYWFQSVSGLKATAGIPADLNYLPGEKIRPSLFNPLILRRAIDKNNDSALRRWVLACLNEPSRDTLPAVLITVLNDEHEPTITFRLTNVTAAGWELGELNAEKSELLMEEIILRYESIEVVG